MADNVELPQPSPNPKPRPKRFVKNQIPDSITADPALNAAISLLPSNYNFEVHKCVWRILSSGAKRVALQFPEGLLMYSLVLSDIFKTFAKVDECLILGDVTYGACCVDDFSASALEAELLIHYGHSCLIPIDYTKIPSLYVFVEIKIDVDRLVDTIRLNVDAMGTKKLALAGTIQFSAAIRAAKPALESAGFGVLIPQAKPLSAGEVLGCTSPTIPRGSVDVVVFVADGRFHLEAFMIANPGIKAFRYDPYLGVLFLEEYDHKGMKEARKNAIMRAREAKSWGIVLGTLGRQGNPRILDRLQNRMREKGFSWTVVLMSEISPPRIALFGDSVDAWIQIACPRLSIDWGDAFEKPLLTPFEAEIALGFIPGWWEKPPVKSKVIVNCKPCESIESCCQYKNGEVRTDGIADYPMDYYAQDGGEWNCSYSRKSSHPLRRNTRSCTGIGDVNSISVGSGTNIQDNSLVHVAKSNISGKVLPTIIGDSVTVGHSAVLHGCTVEDEAFVGMGATLLDGVVVEKHAMVAAGALVRQNTKIPCGEVWGGNPAKFLRKLTDEEIAFISQSATNYTNLAQVHAAENAKTFDEIELEKALRKKFSRRDEEYDSMLGVVRETPPQLILPDNILPDKSEKSSSK